jgi:ferric-dicitrate binding protein FerR (iron transport regulator)
MTTPLDLAAVERYFAGEATPAEAARIRSYLENNPEIAHVWRAALAELDSVRGATGAPDSEQSFEQLWMRARSEDQKVLEPRVLTLHGAEQGRRTPPRGVARIATNRSWSWTGAVLAAAVLVAAMGPAIRRALFPKPVPKAAPVTREVKTEVGQRATLTLADGSTVVLAPATRVRYVDEPGAPREVKVDGEAYFTVVHNATRPFVVRAHGAVVQVLGTSFQVRAYDAAREDVRVVVVDGKVRVKGSSATSADAGAILTEHNAVTVDPAGQVGRVRTDVNVDDELAWTRGEFSLRNAPLGDVLRDFERWYGIHTELADRSMASLPVTATRASNASPNEMLDLMTSTLGLSYERHGSHVTIRRARR